MQKKGLFLQRIIQVKSHELEKIVEIMNDFQNYEKYLGKLGCQICNNLNINWGQIFQCDGKNGLSVGKKAGFQEEI